MTIRISAAGIFVLCLLSLAKRSVHAADQPAEPNDFFREYVGLSFWYSCRGACLSAGFTESEWLAS
jgi:hypothetical protein